MEWTLMTSHVEGSWGVVKSSLYLDMFNPDTDLHVVSSLIYAPISKEPTHHQGWYDFRQ
jgi:hypothetical protein